MIVPYLGNGGWPQSFGKSGPHKAAYECHGDGTLPDLLTFAETDFFVLPDDSSWTMIHTHEDETWGGPTFIRKAWLAPNGILAPAG